MPPAKVDADAVVVDGKLGPRVAEPSLGDLGFTRSRRKAIRLAQARLDKRSHMLKIHQRLGLITLAPLAAALFSSSGAKGQERQLVGP